MCVCVHIYMYISTYLYMYRPSLQTLTPKMAVGRYEQAVKLDPGYQAASDNIAAVHRGMSEWTHLVTVRLLAPTIQLSVYSTVGTNRLSIQLLASIYSAASRHEREEIPGHSTTFIFN